MLLHDGAVHRGVCVEGHCVSDSTGVDQAVSASASHSTMLPCLVIPSSWPCAIRTVCRMSSVEKGPRLSPSSVTLV